MEIMLSSNLVIGPYFVSDENQDLAENASIFFAILKMLLIVLEDTVVFFVPSKYLPSGNFLNSGPLNRVAFMRCNALALELCIGCFSCCFRH